MMDETTVVPKRILFVCLTNLSLSPLFEATVRHRCGRSNRSVRRHAVVESAGLLRCTAGMTASGIIAEEARRHGLDMSCHRARYIGDIGDLSRFAAIVCSKIPEACALRGMVPETPEPRVFCLQPDRGAYMPGWARSQAEAEEMFEIVYRCTGIVVRTILPCRS